MQFRQESLERGGWGFITPRVSVTFNVLRQKVKQLQTGLSYGIFERPNRDVLKVLSKENKHAATRKKKNK